jgi:ComF family protein
MPKNASASSHLLSAAGAGQQAFRLIYPDLCPVCLKVEPLAEVGVCDTCNTELPRIVPPFCNLCGGTVDGVLDICAECARTPRPWDRAVSVFNFGGLARFVVHQLKYRGDVSVSPFLANELLQAWRDTGDYREPDVVTAVPLHWLRRFKRGYNQSELVARTFADQAGLPFSDILVRRHWTAAQSRLSSSERRRNLRKAFAISRSHFQLQDKRVLLIDDVLTTGSTLAACTDKLLKAGAESVEVLTIARG